MRLIVVALSKQGALPAAVIATPGVGYACFSQAASWLRFVNPVSTNGNKSL